MDFRDTPSEAAFRDEVRGWLADHLTGEFAELGGRGGPADESEWDARVEWEKLLGKDRWLGMAWPEELGGRAATFSEQVIFNEEYARANAPARVSLFGEGLFAPTLLAYGTADQQRRFLPKIQSVEELWCQGYSEPGAGSDLGNVQTKGVLDGEQWVVNGQKVWTTFAHRAQWCFCVTRTDAGNVLGEVNDGWKVAMATLGFERGTAFLSQQLSFARELDELITLAQKRGATADPIVRQELADSYVGVQIMKFNGMRMLTSLVQGRTLGPEASIGKLYWSTWHRTLGERALRILGAEAMQLPDAEPGRYELDELHQEFLSSRAETIYAGSSEIQHNIIGERVLGLPREPR